MKFIVDIYEILNYKLPTRKEVYNMQKRENDHNKFVELANKRVNNAIKSIRLIGNLSNRSNYSYTDEDIKKIFFALQKEIKDARRRFEEGSEKERGEFRL